jgi:hypothetical protein
MDLLGSLARNWIRYAAQAHLQKYSPYLLATQQIPVDDFAP